MNQRSMELICNAAEVIGTQEEVRPCKDYSGRGMYGRTTAAVQGARSEILAAAVFAASELTPDEVDEFVEDVRSFNYDNMGRYDVVIY